MDPQPAGPEQPAPNRVTMAMRVSAQAFADEEALVRIDALVAEHPDDVKLLFARACCLEDLARYEQAKRGYSDVLTREPSNFGALTNLGSLLHMHGQRDGLARALHQSGDRTSGRTDGLRQPRQHVARRRRCGGSRSGVPRRPARQGGLSELALRALAALSRERR